MKVAHLDEICILHSVPIICRSWDSSASIKIILWTGKYRNLIQFSTAPGAALRFTQPPIQWIPHALSPGVKLPWCELLTHLYLMLRLGMHGAILYSPLSSWHDS